MAPPITEDPATQNAKRVRGSLERVGEKNFGLARIGFRFMLGKEWRVAALGFAFVKAVDNYVDADPDREHALAWLAERRRTFDAGYDGFEPADPRSEIDADGFALARHDRACGSPLRGYINEELDVIQGDVAGRGRIMTQAELEKWTVDAGRPCVRAISHFTSPRRALPDAYVDFVSRAYLLADSVMDVEEDLAFNVVKIPREAIEQYDMQLKFPDPAIDRWLADYGPVVASSLDEAYRQARRLPNLRTQMLHRLMLGQKRRKFRRFLASRGVTVPG